MSDRLPTREEIAYIINAHVCSHAAGSGDYALNIADNLLARLRPAWEQHTEEVRAWAAKNYGCDKIGPDCPGRCIAKCEDIANLRVTISAVKAERDALRAELEDTQRVLDSDRESWAQGYPPRRPARVCGGAGDVSRGSASHT